MLDSATEGFLLSVQQKIVWKLQKTNLACFTCCVVSIKGRLAADGFRSNLKKIVSRHEILRTHFVHPPILTFPLQVILNECDISFSEVDLTNLTLDEREDELDGLMKRKNGSEQNHPASIHFHLCTVSENEYILAVSLPSIYSDARSIKNLVSEIFRCSDDSLLSEPEVFQYADFSEWQREIIESADPAETSHLSGFGAKFEDSAPLLPFERELSPDTVFAPSSIVASIDQATLNALELLAQNKRISLSDLLLTCWSVLIWHHTNQSRVTINYLYHGRIVGELENALGLFAGYVPIEVLLSGNSLFSHILTSISNTTSLMQTYYEESLSANEEPSENQSRQICFDYVDGLSEIAGGIVYSIESLYSCIDRFKLQLSILNKKTSLECRFSFDPSIYEKDYIRSIGSEFETLLKFIVKNFDCPIERLNIISPEQRQRILVEWNNTEAEFPTDKSFCRLFEEQVERTPDNPALIFGEQQVTYGDINSQSNQLAHFLKNMDIKPEEPVGICMDRSAEMIISILAVLKVGGAYVPINPTHPPRQIEFIIQESSISTVLTERAYQLIFNNSKAKTIFPREIRETLAQQNKENLGTKISPQNLAYIIYTSGSTGRPKGVMITHGSVVNLAHSLRKLIYSQYGDSLRVSLNAPIFFDASVKQLVQLLFGHALCIVPNDIRIDAEELLAFIRTNKIDVFDCTPAQLRFLFNEINEPEQLALRAILVGGEALDAGLLNRLARQKQTNTFNVYGPTECTVDATAKQVKEENERVTIGKPLANTQVYVLDQYLQPVPEGVTGELYIGGAGLARGYGNRAALTAERFVPHPFSKVPGERLYKTGDLVRYTMNGELEYLGRADQQVKIRGYRIELGEIEAALAAHEAVEQAVVVVDEQTGGDKRLVAYLVAGARQKKLEISEIRSFLRERLPEYMIPAVFVELDRLPLTANGKIDRRRLPAPEQTRAGLDKTYVAPRDQTEELLAGIWAQVLGVERVGVEDNFFELGGDSILSIQIIARAAQSGLKLTPRELFQHQTIALLSASAGTSDDLSAPPVPDTTPCEVPLTPIQLRFFEADRRRPDYFNQSLLLEVPAQIDAALLEEAVECLVRHHEALRMRFAQTADERRQFCAEEEENAVFTQIDLTAIEVSEQARFIERRSSELQQSLNLTSGPLVRAGYFDGGRDRAGRLLIVVHHLVVDGVSWRILLEDLQSAYEQLRGGAVPTLPSETISFRQWAHYQDEQARMGVADRELEYWVRQQTGAFDTPPTDAPGAANLEAETQVLSVRLTRTETRMLLRDAAEKYRAQINEVLLSGLGAALWRWRRLKRVLIDVEGHGREQIGERSLDLTRTIGWFTSIYPVALAVGGQAVGAAVKQVKEQLREIPGRGVGYGMLKYQSRRAEVRTALRAGARAEIGFNYWGQVTSYGGELFALAEESGGAATGGEEQRRHLLEVSGIVGTEQELELRCSYSGAAYRRETIADLMEKYREALREIVEQSEREETSGYTPGDFPAVALSQNQLDAILKKTVK